MRAYLERATGRSIELVSRRTYQEVTTLLVARELDAAWICGYPFVRFRSALKLLAVPIWQGRPLYQSYIITQANRAAHDVVDLVGDIHAYSDPDSNSGYLVTRAHLATVSRQPDQHFSRTFFTYGHENVVRAVATGLAQSGSVDGYVADVLAAVDPSLGAQVKAVWKSEWLGFPPIAAPREPADPAATAAVEAAVLALKEDALGQVVLAMLHLDGFDRRDASLYEPIRQKMLTAGLG